MNTWPELHESFVNRLYKCKPVKKYALQGCSEVRVQIHKITDMLYCLMGLNNLSISYRSESKCRGATIYANLGKVVGWINDNTGSCNSYTCGAAPLDNCMTVGELKPQALHMLT